MGRRLPAGRGLRARHQVAGWAPQLWHLQAGVCITQSSYWKDAPLTAQQQADQGAAHGRPDIAVPPTSTSAATRVRVWCSAWPAALTAANAQAQAVDATALVARRLHARDAQALRRCLGQLQCSMAGGGGERLQSVMKRHFLRPLMAGMGSAAAAQPITLMTARAACLQTCRQLGRSSPRVQ